MNCRSCGRPAARLFSARVLGRYDVGYDRCRHCGFIQTEPPYWLAEAYAERVSAYDVWAVSRPVEACPRVARLIDQCWPGSLQPGLDFGGGTGLFTRRMRDLGYPYLWSDAYSPNLFARGFAAADHPSTTRYLLVTCFEVFEHLVDPREQLAALFDLTDTIFFSTTLVPPGVKAADDWFYFAPQHGQHVSFYTGEALRELAAATGSRLLSDGRDQHLLTRAELPLTPAQFNEITSGRPAGLVRRGLQLAGHGLLRLARRPPRGRRESLTWNDWEEVSAQPPTAGAAPLNAPD